MRNIYIDCGTHLGEGLKKHIESIGIDESWDIYTFEANKYTYDILKEKRENSIDSDLPIQYKWICWDNIKYYNKAVWIEDGFIDFYCSTTSNMSDLLKSEDYLDFIKYHDRLVADGDLLLPHQRNDYPVDGSSTIFPDYFRKTMSIVGDNLQKNLVWNEKITIESFDFSNWLRENVTEEDNVVCKIDIETAEFEVLKKCISDNTLRLINVLDVEFHHFNDPIYTKDYRMIMSEINRLGIKFKNW